MKSGNDDAGLLEGLDGEMRLFAASLRAAPQARTSEGFTASVMAAVRAEATRPRVRLSLWRSPWIGIPIAACFALLLGLVSLLNRPETTWTAARLAACQRADGTFSDSSAAPYVQAFAVTALAGEPSAAGKTLDAAVAALIRDQTAEGGWGSAALSVRNVAALHAAAVAGVTGAKSAYRRGLRYLRLNGIGEMSTAELVREAKRTRVRLDATADNGLLGSLALCSVR